MPISTVFRLLLLCALLITPFAGCSTRPKPLPELSRAELAQKLDAALGQRKDSGATYVARVIELPSRDELYLVSPDEPVIPASNMKLPTTAAALDHFGPGHRFKTYLAVHGDDLWIIGTGDPAVGDPRLAKDAGRTPMHVFDQWADALRQRGIENLPGNLYFYDGALDDHLVHPLWSKSFLTDWYAAPVSGLNFNDNCIDVSLTPTTPGQPAAYTVMPPKANFEITNRTTTSTKDHDPEISRAAGANRFTLTGPTTKPAELESKPVTDPGAFFAEAFRARLESRGIHLSGRTLRAQAPLNGSLVPPAESIVATHESTMRDVLSRTNKNSQNLFAEALSKMLGREYALSLGAESHPRGSWESGGLAVRAFLHKAGIDDRGFTPTDGSGLARQNRVTARLMTDLLAAMHAHPHSELFYDSLSVAGQDGTLAKRLPHSNGRLRAKTGYIGSVRALSGYVRTRSGRLLAFSFIFNNIPGSVKPFEELQDQACQILLDL